MEKINTRQGHSPTNILIKETNLADQKSPDSKSFINVKAQQKIISSQAKSEPLVFKPKVQEKRTFSNLQIRENKPETEMKEGGDKEEIENLSNYESDGQGGLYNKYLGINLRHKHEKRPRSRNG